jgi:hypothetical protein
MIHDTDYIVILDLTSHLAYYPIRYCALNSIHHAPVRGWKDLKRIYFIAVFNRGKRTFHRIKNCYYRKDKIWERIAQI